LIASALNSLNPDLCRTEFAAGWRSVAVTDAPNGNSSW